MYIFLFFIIITILHYNIFVHVMKKNKPYHTNLKSNNVKTEIYNQINMYNKYIDMYNKYTIKHIT